QAPQPLLAVFPDRRGVSIFLETHLGAVLLPFQPPALCYDYGWMIRALMLIFDPAGTWEKIEAGPKSAGRLFFLFLLPLMLISSAAEAWGLLHFGVEQSAMPD